MNEGFTGCPFCGVPPSVEYIGGEDHDYLNEYQATCNTLSCAFVYMLAETLDDLRERWNHRPVDAAPAKA
jgi:sarcosine oxidase delta subunit